MAQFFLMRPILGFFAAFFLPLAVLWLWLSNDRTNNQEPIAEEDKHFPNSLNIRSSKDHVSFKANAELQPTGNKDFSMAIWYRLQKLPALEPKSFLVLKYDRDAKDKQGYALAFSRDGDLIRPLVYWGATGSSGKWYNFEAYPHESKKWQVLVLSFIEGKYLGLHLVNPGEGAEGIRLLGGYRFEEPIYAISDSDLFVGGISSGQLPRARIGAFGIFQIKDLNQSLTEQLELIASHKAARPVYEKLSNLSSLFIDDFRSLPSELEAQIAYFPQKRKSTS